MTATTERTTRPTYGNWTTPQTPGLPYLGLLGTVIALGGLVLAVIVQAFAGLLPALVVAVLVLFVLAPLAYRNRAGRNGWQLALAAVAWRLGRAQRQHVYLAGLVDPITYGSNRLPGLLAAAGLVEGVDAAGGELALVHVPATRHYTVLIRVDPDGSSLVDPDVVDTWVAYFGRFLAALAHEPGLVAATATVETAPDPGHKLVAEVDRLLTPGAPALSVQVLRDAAASYPHGSAAIAAHVALTFTAHRGHVEERERFARRSGEARLGQVRTPAEMATMIGGRLPGLLRELSRTGAGTARTMTCPEILDLVRTAYDPAGADDLDALRSVGEDPGVKWETAGPAAAVEAWGSYRHDGAASITWAMAQAPKGEVEATVLTGLLAAHEDVTRKRVTLVYRPHDPASGAAIADADVRTAVGRASDRGRATEDVRVAAARQAAQEEARGAGMTRFSLLVTATVTDSARLAQAAETVDQLGRASRIALRRCYGSQSAAFAAALGVGVVLPSHVSVPAVLSTNL